ncbi:MAG: hypothetical protein LBU77_05335 [Clostridiales bacterium]|nr:hypothetical protein [Clostridiales bacterium]
MPAAGLIPAGFSGVPVPRTPDGGDGFAVVAEVAADDPVPGLPGFSPLRILAAGMLPKPVISLPNAGDIAEDASLCGGVPVVFPAPGDGCPPEIDGVASAVSFPAPEPIGGRTDTAPWLSAPDESAGLAVSGLLVPLFAASADFPIFPAMFLTTICDNMPGIRLRPNGSPVIAGFSPIRVMISSIFLPVRAMATINMHHGTTAAPVGTTDIADSTNFRKMTLKTIIRHMIANIRTQPLNTSAVLLLPPIANASGESIVKMATMTYRSPISKKSFTICTTITMPMMMANSQLASPGIENIESINRGTCTVSGTCSQSITFFVMPSPMSHICRDPTSKNIITTVLPNSIRGSSPSKPSPDSMDFIA